MTQMRLSEEQTKLAMALFNEGKRADFDLEAVLQQFRQECQRRSNLLQMFLEILLVTALADQELHDNEQRLLFRIAESIGYSRFQFEKLLAMAVAQQRYADYEQTRGARTPPLEEAYQALGVKADVSDAELKKAYRRLMSQHHPDKLVAKGLPEEMVKLATEKTQEISSAYKQILASRGG
jgi:DnaJ like chaperone protein